MLLWLKTKLASNYATSAFNIYYETGFQNIIFVDSKTKCNFIEVYRDYETGSKSVEIHKKTLEYIDYFVKYLRNLENICNFTA